MVQHPNHCDSLKRKKDVGFNDTVEKSAADKTELAIDCCSGSTNIVPAFGRVMGKSGISVLKVGDGN